MSRESLRRVNRLTTDTLWVGQQLLIPLPSDVAPTDQPQPSPSPERGVDLDAAGGSPADSAAVDDERRTVSARGGTRPAGDASGGADLSVANPVASETDAVEAQSAAQEFGNSVAQLALQLVGSPYRWAGISPSTGFDCSGLVYYVYQQSGRPIPRTQWPQLDAGPQVGLDELQPGDIVYFANTYEAGLSHNGIYIGDGNFVHSVEEGLGVVVSSLHTGYWSGHYYAANRP